MNCRELLINIDDYLTNRLEDDDRRRFEEHLEECENCRIQVEGDRYLMRLMQSDKVPDPGDSYWSHLENAILSRTIDSYPEIIETEFKSEPRPGYKFAGWLVPLAASFALMFLSFAEIAVRPGQELRADAGNMEVVRAVSGIETSLLMDSYRESEILGSIVMAPPGSPLRTLLIGSRDLQ